MRVCVPLASRCAALHDERRDDVSGQLVLARHFGLAERFALIDSESGARVGECSVVGHCPGACHWPLPNLAGNRVDMLAGPAIGFRLMQLSRRAGLPVVAVQAHTLGDLRDEIRTLFSSGSPLRSSMPAPVCLTGGHRASARQRS